MAELEAPAYTVAEFKIRWAQIKEESRQFDGPSLSVQLAAVEAENPGALEELLGSLSPEQWAHLAYDPKFWLRPKQLRVLVLSKEPGRLVLLILAGRGFGKTRTAAEWVLDRLERGARQILIVGPTYEDAREFMVGGNKRRCEGGNGSGIIDCLPPWIEYQFKEDEGVIEFPRHHCELRIHSALVPEYRGPEPDSVWGDEPIKWRYPERLLTNLRLACRAVGAVEPQIILTTSPKRQRFLRDLVMDPAVTTIHATSAENVGNTHAAVYEDNKRRLTDPKTGQLTRQGAEELGGELGVDEEGDLFPMALIEANRVDELPGVLARIIVSVDPSGSANRTSDTCGIVTLGIDSGGIDAGHLYVLDDASGKKTWEVWGDDCFVQAEKWGASAFVLERNKFADAVAANIRTTGARRGYSVRTQPGKKHLVELVHDREGLDMQGRKLRPTGRVIQIIETLQSASTGDKATRAEPISTLYKTRRVHHLGVLPELDAEISDWDPRVTSQSPGRVDALVTGATELCGLDRSPARKADMTGIAAANEALSAAATSRGGGNQWLSVGRDRRRSI